MACMIAKIGYLPSDVLRTIQAFPKSWPTQSPRWGTISVKPNQVQEHWPDRRVRGRSGNLGRTAHRGMQGRRLRCLNCPSDHVLSYHSLFAFLSAPLNAFSISPRAAIASFHTSGKQSSA